jgi:SAM-dependent methyltransferase
VAADRGVERSVLALYADASLRDRLHVRLRLRSCPFAAVAAAVPSHGSVLDVGCGHGASTIYLALMSPDRSVVGIDIDARKIAIAHAARTKLREPDRVKFSVTAPDEPIAGIFDAVVIVDVLYLIAEACAALKPGGCVVVKETAFTPSWKFRITELQEDVMVRVLRVTKGKRGSFEPPERIAGWMRQAGLEVTETPLARGHVHPHHLIVGTMPG